MHDPIDELRRIAAETPRAPEAMATYLDKVRTRAFTITDGDVETLKQSCSEDEIFEQTVAAAIGEGLRRLDFAREAIG